MIGGIAGVDVAGNPYGWDETLFRSSRQDGFDEW